MFSIKLKHCKTVIVIVSDYLFWKTSYIYKHFMLTCTAFVIF